MIKRVIRLGTGDHLSAWRVVDAEHVYDFAELLDHDIDTDLARRDFTVNAMAVPLASGDLMDPYDGRGDVARRIVRMVDAANFDDDPLRCLKGVRMAVTLDFEIEPGTIAAIAARAESITRVARERVSYEIGVIFSAGRLRRAVELLRRTALDEPLFSRELDVSAFHSDDASFSAAMALIVRDARAYGRQWRWSEQQIRDVATLQKLLDTEGDRRVALYDAGEAVARQLPGLLRTAGRDDRVVMPDFTIRSLLAGEELGVEEGPELGRLKRALLEAQIRGEVKTREEAQAFVRSLR
jgi:tRNA nucleotidyltransferase/poly(A) polymerase